MGELGPIQPSDRPDSIANMTVYRRCVLFFKIYIYIYTVYICSGYEMHEYSNKSSNPRMLTYENAPIITGIKSVYPELSHYCIFFGYNNRHSRAQFWGSGSGQVLLVL